MTGIVLFIVYLVERNKPAGGSRDSGEVCLVCRAVMKPEWAGVCPFCARKKQQQQAEVAVRATMPIDTPRRVEPAPARMSPSGQKTVILNQKEYKVYAFLVIKEGIGVGREFPLFQERTVVGRDGTVSQIPVDDQAASREHCAILFKDNEFQVRDLASQNGTFINPTGIDDKPIDGAYALKDGDVIGVGKTRLVFKRVW
jgi:hypothetical protein